MAPSSSTAVIFFLLASLPSLPTRGSREEDHGGGAAVLKEIMPRFSSFLPFLCWKEIEEKNGATVNAGQADGQQMRRSVEHLSPVCCFPEQIA